MSLPRCRSQRIPGAIVTMREIYNAEDIDKARNRPNARMSAMTSLFRIGHQQVGQLPNAFLAGVDGSGSTPGYGSSSASC
jgi:hypothetical protein